jgi:carboxypeptidase family protein
MKSVIPTFALFDARPDAGLLLKRDDGEYNASDHYDRSNHASPRGTKSAHRLPGRAAGVCGRGLPNVNKERQVKGILFMLLLKSLRIGFVGLMLFVASAWAASSVLEGIVKDAKGHPIEGADIRIETKNGGKLLTTVKTDVRGRYILEGLPSGNYRVTLAVTGAVKTSINNTTIESDEPTQLNFDLAAAPASRASVTVKKGRHWVWIPAFSGSRLPGHWVELNDSGSWAGEASSFNVVRVSGEELQRTIHSRDLPAGAK